MTESPAIARLREKLNAPDEGHFAAAQLLELYATAQSYPGGTFLELGTDRGQGSNAILASCDTMGGRLVSVDIRDCSAAASSPNWAFVQASSVDRDAILARAPFLADGIDMMYIDSLHTPKHVQMEIYTWFDLVREGGSLYFDDVDSGPYMAGRRKDNPKMEIDNRRIRELLEQVFYTNTDKLEMAIHYGSTGLAHFRKRARLGERLDPIGGPLKRRHNEFLAKLAARFGRTRYVHKRDGSDFV